MATQYGNALITGASSGMGRELSLWFAKRGTKVYAAGRRLELLQKLAGDARALGGVVEPVKMDVAEGRKTFEQIGAIDAQCNGLDLVIANAGVGLFTDGRKMNWDRVERVLQTNVLGAAATISAVVSKMVERRRGHLVGISSLGAFRSLPRVSAYCASKAFLAMYLQGLRLEVRSAGVKVTTIYPGFVKSEMTAGDNQPAEKMPFILEASAAADRIGKAILRGTTEYAFPWQMSLPMHLMRLAPDAVIGLAFAPPKQRAER